MAPRRRSLFLAVSWWILLFVGASVLFSFGVQSLAGLALSLFFLPLFVKAGYRAADTWREAQRYRALQQEARLQNDPRRRVLYLRSFAEDGDIPEEPLWMTFVLLLNGGPFSGAFKLSKSYEQNLCSKLNKIGPVIALAKPQEELPELGATRLHAPESRWQAEIKSLIESAVLVVVNFGQAWHSDGLWWELSAVVDLKCLPKLILWLQLDETDRGVRQARYGRLRTRLETVLQRPLPVELKNHQFLYFPGGAACLAKSLRRVLADQGLRGPL